MQPTALQSPILRDALTKRSESGILSFADFMDVALYHPKEGYYARQRKRVGRDRSTDFFTASSFSDLFAIILQEATETLLAATGRPLSEFNWVEIGAEPDAALMAGKKTPFKTCQAIRYSDNIEISGDCIVFSNELFDAQPFHTLLYIEGHWQERCVQLLDDGIQFINRRQISPELTPYLDRVPQVAPEGYTIDIPTRTIPLLEQIATQPWNGLFIAFDYGKTWQALCYDTPQGTARAYRNHQQIPNILEDAGQQDLTCHICWDFLENILNQQNFQQLILESQESFVIRRAPKLLADSLSPRFDALSKQRSQLKQLIHPSLMGQKFQVLSALKPQLIP